MSRLNRDVYIAILMLLLCGAFFAASFHIREVDVNVAAWAELFKRASEDPALLKQMQAKGTGVKWVGPGDYAKWFEKTYKDHEKVAIKIGMFKK